MKSRLIVVTALLVLFPSLFTGSVSALPPALGNPEQRVNGHGMRGDAQQFSPDISGDRIVWQDLRGTSTSSSRNSIWSKDLSTRDEAPVTTVATNFSAPSVSGNWVVWADASPAGNPDLAPLGNMDIFARQLPSGSVITVTANTGDQLNPSIDGTLVVWEDHRNSGTSGVDIFKKDLLAGSESAVTTATGDQFGPRVSGSTIVWQDQRRGSQFSDIYSKTGNSAEAVVELGTNHYPAISGTRVVWSKTNNTTFVHSVITCVLPCSTTQTVSPSSQSQIKPDVSGNRIVWNQYDGINGSNIFHKDMSGGATSQVDSGTWSINPAIDGSKVTWEQHDGNGDIFWRDLVSGAGPTRANSVGLGPFVDHTSASASTADNVVVHNTFSDQFQVFATNLNGSRRDYAVSSLVATGVSPPRLSSFKTVWSDYRNCAIDDFSCPPDVFTDSAASPGSDQPVTTTASIGNPPDIDGTQTVWICGTSRLCLDDAGADSAFNLPVSVSYTVQDLVRVDNGVALWSEINFWSPYPYPSSKLHALKLSTGEDSILQSGSTGAIMHWDPGYDISGANVVWSSDGIYKNTISFPCGGACDRSSSATRIAKGAIDDAYSEPSLDGTKVAFTDCSDWSDCNILLQDISTGVSQTVTSAEGYQTEPFIDGDRVYWTDEREGHADIYMQSISGAPLPAPDTTAPSPVTGLTAGGNTGSIQLNWTNPSNIDLLKIRILRKSGTTAPSGIDDTSASVVFDGLATSFTDNDVVNGLKYSYAAWAYDTEGNLSTRVIATSTQAVPAGAVFTEGLGGILIGGPDAASWADGRMDVFVIGGDSALWQRTFQGGSWGGWGSLGGRFTSDPSAVSWADGRIDVFGRGGDNALWHASFSGGVWSGWESLGGVITSAPDVASWGSGRLDVFARGGDNAVWRRSWNGSSWTGWESLGGIIKSDPTAVSWGLNRIDIFARGGDNALWRKSWNGSSWTDWSSLGGILIGGPDATSTSENRLEIFVIGGDKALWTRSWTGVGWTDWSTWGGIYTSDPAAVSMSADRLDVYGRGADNALWHKWQDGSP